MMQPVTTLFDNDENTRQPALSSGLQEIYSGDLGFPEPSAERPYVFGNFVSTLDGVVSYKVPGKAGGGAISGSDEADRFIMGLLRASADAIVVGAGTVLEVGRRAIWTPAFIYPPAKELYRDYRASLGKPEQPVLTVVTGNGRIDLDRAVFRTPEMPVVVVTSARGRDELLQGGIATLPVQVKVLPSSNENLLEPGAILQLLASEFGARAVLHEGGPSLFGQFVSLNLVDELFLTVAPQLAGRLSHTDRPGLIRGVEFQPDTAPWWRLVSIKQRGAHVYLRFRRR